MLLLAFFTQVIKIIYKNKILRFTQKKIKTLTELYVFTFA